ncbi:MAG: DNA polymerase III subunit alpha [Vicinamibacterales bacterium]
MSYIELHAASAFSFLQGASLPEALVERAAALDYPAVALLDRDGVYGMPRFHKAARSAGLRPIVGAELTIGREGREGPAALQGHVGRARLKGTQSNLPHQPSPPFVLPLLCESPEGYRNLCRLITRMKLASPKGEGALPIEALDGMTGGLVALVGRVALDANRFGVGGLLDRIVGLFGRDRTYVELQRHFRRDEEADNQALVAMAGTFRVPLLATNGVRFATPAERPLFDVLTCIHHHADLASAGRRLTANAERYLKPRDQVAALFADHPQAIANSLALADRLQFTMADLGYRFPEYPVPSGETQASFLRRITDVGARHRYRPYHDKARAQIARELDLIEKLDLAGYFLIVWDIVNFCRQHDILVQGRGSAANSAVCYSLGITAVDPVGMELLFERFLSEERGEWPDIDLDLPSGDRRERVIQHVYEKYGQHGAAMTANVITYRGRSAAREVGKVLGFDPPQVDRLAKAMNHFEFVDANDTLPRHLASVGLDLNANRVRLFAKLWQEMQDLPRHLGQHSGGMVICQGRLDSVVPLENASMPGRVVVQWDKDDCADMGIVKVDLLGLGMMAAIQDALALVNGERRPELQSADFRLQIDESPGQARSPEPEARSLLVDLAHLPQDDPAVYRMLQEADTVGVFQVESRAQMATLPRLKPVKFYDLVVQVAIIRPGPIVGQMVHPYLNRRAGREAVVYAHPSLEPVLRRTLGVPLFQEQLLRMAMVVANFTGGQAEELRRAMGFKRSEKRMKQIELQLREGMARNGIAPEAMEQIILSITSFALYGFPESHAASFALLAYASAYLKAHYPSAFYTALLNNQPMGFYHPSTLVKDAQRRGVRFQPIDVQVSDWDCTVEPDGAVRLGLRYVSGLRAEAGKAIAAYGRTARLKAGTTPESRSVRLQPDDVLLCPKCGCDDPSMLDKVEGRGARPGTYYCNNCSHDWVPGTRRPQRFATLDELVSRIGLRRDEVVTLAEIGALNAFGYDRRAALWQAERAVRPSGALFEEREADHAPADPSGWLGPAADLALAQAIAGDRDEREPGQDLVSDDEAECPLRPMTEAERLVADYAGTGLTVGRHPMALRRHELAMRGVMRATDLRTARQGRMVRVAGMVITRQRPGTAKGFVFLTLEDETGIANIIVRPDLFARDRGVIVEEPFLLVEGVLQHQDGVVSVRAEIVQGLGGTAVDFEPHDFY